METTPGRATAFASLRQFVRRPAEQPERCELCAKTIAGSHQHLLELEKHKVTCVCDACAILFSENSRQPYRRIPRDVRPLRDFTIDDLEWESLLIPINLAFFIRSEATNRFVAQYPSPAGAMESTLDLEYWNAIEERNPLLKQFQPEVEALLVNRITHPARYYRAPIDQCYRLVGVIRNHWRGISGGTQVWQEIAAFFARLDGTGVPRA